MSNHKHGKAYSTTYNSWRNAIARCNDPDDVGYDNYGARGIKVVREWHSFANFLRDMGERPEGTTLDRIDNNKNYCLANCRWSPKVTQARNRRNSRLITYKGATHCISEWAEFTGLSVGCIWARLKNGWDEEKSLTTPTREWNAYKKAKKD
jgi:hypothetical protein